MDSFRDGRGRARGGRYQMPGGANWPRNVHRSYEMPERFNYYQSTPPSPFQNTTDGRPYMANGYNSFQYFPEQPPFETTGGWQSNWDHYPQRMPQHPPFGEFHDYQRQGNWTAPTNRFPNPPPTMNNGSGGPYGQNGNSHPPTNQERYRLFETMLRCGEKLYGKTYLAIYWLEFKELDTHLSSPLFENDREGHAEEYLMKHLLLQLEVIHKDRLKSVTIIQNASPCSRCAARYKKDLEDHQGRDSGVNVSIVFSSFHWLRRLSCRHEGHKHKFVSKEKHEENREGLRQLRFYSEDDLLRRLENAVHSSPSYSPV